GWVKPLMVTGTVMAGRPEPEATWMTWTPLPGMLKLIVEAVPDALASRIAWRSEPGPLLAAVMTVKVDGTSRASSGSRAGQNVGRRGWRARWSRHDCDMLASRIQQQGKTGTRSNVEVLRRRGTMRPPTVAPLPAWTAPGALVRGKSRCVCG